MSVRTARYASLGLIALCILAGIIVYPSLPERIASHWNAAGQVDGYASKSWGLAFLPLTLVVLFAVFAVIPLIDPLKANIARFERYYAGFVLAVMAFLAYLYGLTLAWNLGASFALTPALVPGMAALIFLVGVLLEHAEPNWFIGIRTPWTLSSATVWSKTHRAGGPLFKLAGVATMPGVLLPSYWALLWALVPLAVVSVYLVVYSYREYQKEIRAPGSPPER